MINIRNKFSLTVLNPMFGSPEFRKNIEFFWLTSVRNIVNLLKYSNIRFATRDHETAKTVDFGACGQVTDDGARRCPGGTAYHSLSIRTASCQRTNGATCTGSPRSAEA